MMLTRILILMASLFSLSSAMAAENAKLTLQFKAESRPAYVRFKWHLFAMKAYALIDTTIKVNEHGEAYFETEAYRPPTYLQVEYLDSNKQPLVTRNKSKAYIVLSGDSVNLVDDGKSCIWQGTGVAKYQLIDRLADIPFYKGKLINVKGIQNNCRLLVRHLDTVFESKARLINDWRNLVGNEIAELLLTSLLAEKNNFILTYFESQWSFYRDSVSRDSLRQFYYSDISRFPANLPKADKAWLFPDYRVAYLELSKLITPPEKPKRRLNELFDLIIQDSVSTELKTMCMFVGLTSSVVRSKATNLPALIDIADMYSNTPELKKLANSLRTTTTPGRPVFPFQLTDTQGKMVSSQQLRGQTLLLKFWFTGCAGCVGLADQLRTIKDSFPPLNVKVVSISVDKEKDKWLASVLAETYGSKEDVNLYTNGLGYEHPLVKYYRIKSYPYLIVVDSEGNLFDVSPPRPSDAKSTQDFLATLRKAMFPSR